MAVLGVTEHHFLGLPDGGLADHDRDGIALGRAPARRRPARHDPHVRCRRHDLPPRPHRRAPLGHAGVVRPRPPGSPAVRHADRRAPRPLRRPLRGVGHVHDRRAAGRRAGRATRPRTSASTGSELDRKLAALRAMATQTGGAVRRPRPGAVRRHERRGVLRGRRPSRARCRHSRPPATSSATVAPGAAVDGEGDGAHSRIAGAADRRRQPAGDHRRIGARPAGRGDRVQRRRRPR